MEIINIIQQIEPKFAEIIAINDVRGGAGISLTSSSANAQVGNDISIPLTVTFPDGNSYSSAQITLSGYKSGLTFLGIDTTNSLLGPAGWLLEYHETDSLLVIATAGATDISGGGTLLNLKFAVTGSICTSVSITLVSALFNTGADPVSLTSGTVDIKPIPVYGDVDQNGEVQAYDASLVLKELAEIIAPFECQAAANTDVNVDATISAWDASVILRYLDGEISQLPYTTAIPAVGQVVAQNLEVGLNQVLDIPIAFSGAHDIYSFEATIQYDPSILKFQSVKGGTGVAGFTVAAKLLGNQIHIFGASSTPLSHDGIVVTAEFLSRKNGKASPILSSLRLNTNPEMKDIPLGSFLVGVHEGYFPTPKEFSLSQNYPNLFNPVTTIQYALPSRSNVKLEVFTTLGTKVSTLVDGNEEAGYHNVKFDGNNLSSGLYYYRITAGSFTSMRKLLLVK